MAVNLGEEWNLSPEGKIIVSNNNTIQDKKILLKIALDLDLKEIGCPVLSKLQNKSNISQVVLQIQKIRNISAPKANENSQTAPRMLKLILTDGDTYLQAIEILPIPQLSTDKTPPGAKILIRSAKLCAGYILLDSKNCTLLGGRVPALYEKWELSKSVQHHNRQNTSSDGPPAWVNFGAKVYTEQTDDAFKSLDTKKEEIKENSKFDLQRQDAIAEATSGAVKKVFGGGNKQIVPPTVPIKTKPTNGNWEKKNQKIKSTTNDSKDFEEKVQKPSDRVSLFDFLEDKLPSNTQPTIKNNYQNVSRSTEYQAPANVKNNHQNNYYSGSANAKNSHQNYYSGPKNYQASAKNSFQNNYSGPKQAPATVKNNYQNDSGQSQANRNRNNYYNNSDNRNNFYRTNNVHDSSEPHRTENKYKSETENIVDDLSSHLNKVTLNSEFASRSLKQHLNLGPQKQNKLENGNSTNNKPWNIGDDCVAKYWEDGKFYNATITAITDKTFVVKFKGYGNLEEVLKSDCLPMKPNDSHRKSHYGGSTEFRRSDKTYRKQ